jgi:hypothetical protein
VTGRPGAALVTVAGLVAFAAVFYWRLDAAYGPFNLGREPADWLVLWELWRAGQIAGSVVAQAVGLGALAAAAPWLLRALWRGPAR